MPNITRKFVTQTTREIQKLLKDPQTKVTAIHNGWALTNPNGNLFTHNHTLEPKTLKQLQGHK